MTPSEFTKYLESLANDKFSEFIQERIARLYPEQQIIAQAREVKRKELALLIARLADPNLTEDDHHCIFNALRDAGSYADDCEHGRPYCKHCTACGEIEHIMFPELFNKDGFLIEEEEQEEQRPETD